MALAGKPINTKVTELTRRLVRAVLQDGGNDGNRQVSDACEEHNFQYALRILGSRMYPTMNKDELHICEVVKKKRTNNPLSIIITTTLLNIIFHSCGKGGTDTTIYDGTSHTLCFCRVSCVGLSR
jgi:hypothetical protein